MRVERDAYLSAGKYYEALQLYKTLYARYMSRREYAAAATVLRDGIGVLFAHTQSAAAGELCSCLVEVWNKSDTQPTAELLQECTRYFWWFTADAETPRVSFAKAVLK